MAQSKSAAAKGSIATKGNAVSKESSTKAAQKKSTAGRGTTTIVSNGSKGKATAKTPSGSAAGSRGKAVSTGAPSHKDSLEKIMKDMLKDIYWAEKHLHKALGKMAKNASHEELSEAFLTHQEQTEGQIAKLESVFATLGMKVQGKKCPAMEGLVQEGNEEMEEYAKGAGRDAAIIVAAQKAEHYEIAAYGSLRTFATTLGYDDVAQIFEEILTEESETDELLTQIAHTINEEAVGDGEDDGMDADEEAEMMKPNS